jgi:hypothetical protein
MNIDKEDEYLLEQPWHYSGGYLKRTDGTYLHRLVVKASEDEYVHHKNGVRDDNRKCNLEKMSKYEHDRIHTPITGTVWRDKRRPAEGRPWLISIRYNKKQKVFGNFEDQFTARHVLKLIQEELI